MAKTRYRPTQSERLLPCVNEPKYEPACPYCEREFHFVSSLINHLHRAHAVEFAADMGQIVRAEL